MATKAKNEIGGFVRSRRKANKLTQRELAELAGVGTRFVSDLERGKETVQVDTLNRILGVLGKQVGIVDARRMEKGREDPAAGTNRHVAGTDNAS